MSDETKIDTAAAEHIRQLHNWLADRDQFGDQVPVKDAGERLDLLSALFRDLERQLAEERQKHEQLQDDWGKDCGVIGDLRRQLTAERERADTLLDAIQWLDPQLDMFATDMATRQCHLIAEHLRETAREWRKRVEDGRAQPYAPAKPCPDCGATDRAHTCPNWREWWDRTTPRGRGIEG